MILDLLQKRWSVRKFRDQLISEDILHNILEAGRIAPSGGNEQAWCFGVVTNPQIINQLAEVAYNQRWIASAPLVIVLCTKIVAEERGAREIQKFRFPEWAEEIRQMDQDLYSKINLEEHQTKIAGTYMTLVALEAGIGSTWVSYFHVEKVAEILELEEGVLPTEILVMGYPDEEPKFREKKALEEVVFYR